MKTLEICIDSIESAIAAQRGGASRVELCDNLVEGGTTPSMGMVAICREVIDIDIMVMIRPRGGDFLYTSHEFAVMRRNIQDLKKYHPDITGVVLGILLPDGQIDMARVRELVELARPFQVTFHRAFDMTPEPLRALDNLMELGIDRLLTSGQEATVPEGVPAIGEYVRYVGDSMSIMPGGGVNEDNVSEIIRKTGVGEVHCTAKHAIPSKMIYQNPRVYMGVPGSAEYERFTVSEDRVRKMVKTINHT